jgi:hypothetical protein
MIYLGDLWNLRMPIHIFAGSWILVKARRSREGCGRPLEAFLKG